MPRVVDDILSRYVPKLVQSRDECLFETEKLERFRHVYGADAKHLVRPLCACSKRPRECSACQNSNELPPIHSITSSARARSAGGKVTARALAVFRFMTSSNLVGCSIGRSAGLAPLKILST